MFSKIALRNLIKFSLQSITVVNLYSPEAEEILMMIAAHESHLGLYTSQQGGGPAKGVLQVEGETMLDNYVSYLTYRKDLLKEICEVTGTKGADLQALEFNPIYNIIHGRLKLYRSPGKLPGALNADAMAIYAKTYFNGPGKATAEKYLKAYKDLVLV